MHVAVFFQKISQYFLSIRQIEKTNKRTNNATDLFYLFQTLELT